MKNKLYVAASNDEYELPCFVEESLDILAVKLKCEKSTLKSCISRANHGKTKHITCNNYIVYSVSYTIDFRF